MYSASVDGSSVTNPRSYRAKRQLPPIEQGNMVIDSIFQIPIKTLSAVGTLIKTARPLVRRTRERIQQYYTGYQQQYSNGQQQYGNGQQQYGYGLQQYNNGQQYYTSGQKRYSIGRQNSNTDPQSRQYDGGEEFVYRPKRAYQVTNWGRNNQPEYWTRRLYGIYWYLQRFVTEYYVFRYKSIIECPAIMTLIIIEEVAALNISVIIQITAHILYIIHWKIQI